MTMGDSNLVSAGESAGTSVYGADDSKAGTIDRVMIDKVSGTVAYAVMNFGGILGMGGEKRPVPWNMLSYDTGFNGFRTKITEEQLSGAPAAQDGWHSNRDWEERTHRSHGAEPYWL